MRLPFALLLAAILVACPHVDPPQPPYPPQPDAGFDDEESDAAGRDDCSFACQAARRVGCSAGFSVDGGASCTASCRHVRDTRLTRLDVACMRNAVNSSAAKQCAGWGCQ